MPLNSIENKFLVLNGRITSRNATNFQRINKILQINHVDKGNLNNLEIYYMHITITVYILQFRRCCFKKSTCSIRSLGNEIKENDEQIQWMLMVVTSH